jgi:hypothetical protein
MIFEWPIVLWLLLVVPLLIAGYRIVLERKEIASASFARWTTNTGTAAARWKQSLPPTLFLIAIVALITAMARPVAVISLPSLQDNVILAIDVSNSMMADDLQPTRLAAAQQAAKAFIDEQPLTTKIGIVAFAETALLIQRPTDSREDLMKAVDRLKAQEGTAVGGAILVGLQALFPKETFDGRSRFGYRVMPDSSRGHFKYLPKDYQGRKILGLDHDLITFYAWRRLRYAFDSKVDPMRAMGLNPLGREFRLSDLQELYEVSLGKTQQRDAFRRQMLEQTNPYIEESGTTDSSRQGKPAKVYRLKSWAEPRRSRD